MLRNQNLLLNCGINRKYLLPFNTFFGLKNILENNKLYISTHNYHSILKSIFLMKLLETNKYFYYKAFILEIANWKNDYIF